MGWKEKTETKEETKKIYSYLRKFKVNKIVVMEKDTIATRFKARAMYKVKLACGWRILERKNQTIFNLSYLTNLIRDGVKFRLATDRETLLFYTHGRNALIKDEE